MIDQPLEASDVCRSFASVLPVEGGIRHSCIANSVVGKMAMNIEFGPSLIQIRLKTRDLIIQSEDAFLESSHKGGDSRAEGAYHRAQAGVAEWQTRRTQNPLSASSCGFESHSRYWSWIDRHADVLALVTTPRQPLLLVNVT